MRRDEVEIVQDRLQRWIIVQKSDPQLAWSGSEWVPHEAGIPTGDTQVCNFDSCEDAESYIFEQTVKVEIKKLRSDIVQRLERTEAMSKVDIRKKIEEARAWVMIMQESQAAREKYGQQLATDFQLELGNDAAAARNKIDDLEKEVYGGVLAALRKRIENVERAFQEKQEGQGQ